MSAETGARITSSRRRSWCGMCGASELTRTMAQRVSFIDRHVAQHERSPWPPPARPARQPRHGWPTWAIVAGAAALALLVAVL